MQMSDIDFGEIKVTSKHKEEGVWWGDAAQIADVAIDTQPDTATSVGILFAGKKAIDIVQRGYSFADPERDEPDLDLGNFVDERLVEGVLLRPHGIHAFQRHLSLGVGLFSLDREENRPFGLVVPGKGAIVHRGRIGDYKRVVSEAHLLGPLDKPDRDAEIASKAISLCVEYAKLPKASIPLALH